MCKHTHTHIHWSDWNILHCFSFNTITVTLCFCHFNFTHIIITVTCLILLLLPRAALCSVTALLTFLSSSALTLCQTVQLMMCVCICASVWQPQTSLCVKIYKSACCCQLCSSHGIRVSVCEVSKCFTVHHCCFISPCVYTCVHVCVMGASHWKHIKLHFIVSYQPLSFLWGNVMSVGGCRTHTHTPSISSVWKQSVDILKDLKTLQKDDRCMHACVCVSSLLPHLYL